MSHACFHRPFQVATSPVEFLPVRPACDLFSVRLKYRENGDVEYFSLVHIPPSIQDEFTKGAVQGLHLETLETNGAASRALKGQLLIPGTN